MDRRLFFNGFSQPGLRSTRKLNSGIAPYNGTWGYTQVKHLLNRALFGATEQDIQYFMGLTPDAAVNELLTPALLPSPPVNNYSSVYNDTDVAAGQTWVNATMINTNSALATSFRRDSFKAWWYGLMLNQNRSIHEKMTLFWHNLFATEADMIPAAQPVYITNNTLRTHALGNFKTLTKQVTLDPGMLYYLNGYLNGATAPDENYARELQELFTVGKGPGSGYTEEDVKAAARVLTGYRINYLNITTYFDANQHNTTNKQFSAFYGNTIINGQSGAAGANELDSLLDMIFSTQEVAKYICRRLYNFFLYYEIDQDTETNVIEPLADIFRTNNYDIIPVLAAFFKSEHFYDAANFGCLIKNPLDFTVGLFRVFGSAFPATSDYNTSYDVWGYVQRQTATMGMEIGDPPAVAGWPAYHQEPLFHELWINSDTLSKRISFVRDMMGNGYTSSGFTLKLDLLAFVAGLPNPSDPNLLISELTDLLYSIPVSQTYKDFLKGMLLNGQTMDYIWSNAWNDYVSDPLNQTFLTVVQTRLESLFDYMLTQAEFHLI